MPYSEFTIDLLKRRFNLRVNEDADLFAPATPIAVSQLLTDNLQENLPLALAISTEKARSEMIIAPVLIEVRRQYHRQISLFSGVEFTVDASQGLNGICDYLLSLSAEQLTIEAPVVAIVEAKNENIKQGIGQCIAEMVAVQLYNQQRHEIVPTIYGVVTTGNIWKFMRLQGTVVALDSTEYYIKEVERIVGILVSMFHQEITTEMT